MRSDVAHVHYTSTAPIEDSKRRTWFDDDSEWEYEYNENETEDFFFNLDLTTHVPDALTKRETARNGKWARGTMEARVKKTTFKKYAPKEDSAKPSDDPAMAMLVNQSPAPGAAVLRDSGVVTGAVDDDANNTAEPESAGTLQFVGLHTASPYLIFNDQFYSAYWLTQLGTQIWVSRPGVSDSVIYKGQVLDIIGISRARLMARPAKIQPRADTEEHIAPSVVVDDAVQPQNDDAADDNDGNANDNDDNDDATFAPEHARDTDTAAGPLSIPQSSVSDPTMRSHARFMERFSALKWKRGERDQMPLHSVKQYEFPANAEEIRKKALEAEGLDTPNKRQRLDMSGAPAHSLPYFGTIPTMPPVKKPTPRRQKPRPRKTNNKIMEATDSEDGDVDPESNDEDDDDEGEDTRYVEEDQGTAAKSSRTKVPIRQQARNARLESIGLRDPDEPRPPRRRRRTKAEMEAARQAEEQSKYSL